MTPDNQSRHLLQRTIWEREHENPKALPQLDDPKISSGVQKFIDWAEEQDRIGKINVGIEMGCGKGRNVIGIAKTKHIPMVGIDFSEVAIKEAAKRAEEAGVEESTLFRVHDVAIEWDFESSSFDLGIDCFASTDLEDPRIRKFAARELIRVVRPGGYLLVYTLSPNDEFHQRMMADHPAGEPNAFLDPDNNKFEKTFSREELIALYDGLQLITEEQIHKRASYQGEEYTTELHWMVFKKPIPST